MAFDELSYITSGKQHPKTIPRATMIDTINLRLSAYDVGGRGTLLEATRNLPGMMIATSTDTGEICGCYGNVGNLKISVNEESLTLRNSLCKFMMGDNFKTMNRADLVEVVAMLEDMLHLPISRADVTRMDVGTNFALMHPVEVYLRRLGDLRYFRRVPMVEVGGLYYKQTERELNLYDKCKEARNHKTPIPEAYQAANILRYEQRLIRHIPRYYKRNQMQLRDVCRPDVYADIVSRWEAAFNSIRIVPSIKIEMDMIENVSTMKNAGLLALIQMQGGVMEFLAYVDELKAKRKITKQNAARMKSEIKRIVEVCAIRTGADGEDDVINELRAAVRESAEEQRQS